LLFIIELFTFREIKKIKKKSLLNEVRQLQKIAGILKENLEQREPVKTFTFGYDLENIEEVEKYVTQKYGAVDSQDLEGIKNAKAVKVIGYGDDTMNGLEIYDSSLLKDPILMDLIDNCEGGGEFEEGIDDDEAERDKILNIIQDNYGISDAVQEFLDWDEEDAENADGTNWDDVVDAIMEDPELKARILG
jgi:hypothetical protein